MLTLTENQIRERWDALPENLREAIYSETNVDIVTDACAANHLSEERTVEVKIVVSDVLMGFLRADIDDVSREIRERANIHPNIAYAIAKEIDKRVFLPLRNDLERVYAPPRKEKILGHDTFKVPAQETIPIFPETNEPEEKAAEPEPRPQPETPTERIISPLQREIEVKKAQEAAPSAVPETAEEPAMETPFILHREEELFSPSAPPEKPSVSVAPPPEPKKPFSAPRKITVRIETPDGEERGEARVVHYSALRTPLDKDSGSSLA